MINGIINVYKEPGYTSHDVVAKLRGMAKQKKIGHTGTLDPAAEGVLPVCLGKATRLCEWFSDDRKSYEAVLLLGVNTDTLDTTGTVLRERPVEVSEEQVRQCMTGFTGDLEQIPPMYSALKQNGKKLYELAREGKTVERKARPIHIYELTILELSLPRVRFSVTCSKGTYVRSLCEDIGESLGCGGCMEHLIRTAVGQFRREEALTLQELQTLTEEGRFAEAVLPLEEVLSCLPVQKLPAVCDKALHNGNRLPKEVISVSGEEAARGVCVYDSEGILIGIYVRDKKEWKPEKMFYAPEQ